MNLSCTKVQAIGFSSDQIKMVGMFSPEIENIPSEYRNEYEPQCRIIDLQKYIDKVAGKVDEDGHVIERGFPSQAEFNAITDPAERIALFGTDQYSVIENDIKALAQQITNDIIDEIVEKGYKDHFIRIAKDDTNPYQIDFYDIRDTGALNEAAAAVTPGAAYQLPSGSVSFVSAFSRVESKVLIENQPVTLTRADEYNYYIQMGANSNQGVEIEFPDTSLKGIDLEDYSVFRDGYCSITEDKKYDASMLNGAEDLGNHIYRNGHIGGQELTVPTNTTFTVYNYTKEAVLVKPAGTNEFGEYSPAQYDYVLKQGNPPWEDVTVNYSYTTMVGGYDATFEAYKPDDIWRIDRAIANLSDKRSYLGAMHNRLEHAYANDTNTSENLQAAESKLRDADMADEMVAFSAANILEQAGTSMLAQANQSKQGILSLLS